MWTYNSELYHHGIKGQKWGVRRFQNEDGSLTDAGRKRYNVDIDRARATLEDARSKYNKASAELNKGFTITRSQAYDQAQKDLEWARRDLKSEKIKNKLNSEKSKSKHREKLEARYREKGMSEEEAAVAAYKRDKTEKIVAAIGGLAIAATAAYVGYKEYDKRVDKFLSSDVLLKRIATNDNKSVHEGFYAALGKNKGDVNRYVGLFGRSLASDGNTVYQKTIKLGSGLKVASEKTASAALKEMISGDKSSIEYLRNIASEYTREIPGVQITSKQWMVAKRAEAALSRGRIDDSVYELFNLSLAGGENKLASEFYRTLRQKGFGAIQDLNDRRWSGYNSKNPVVVFDVAEAVVENVRQVPLSEMVSQNKIELGKLYLSKTLPTYGKVIGGTVAGVKLASIARKNSENDRIVSEYRKEHPNTDLSYNEILRNHGRTKG